MWAAACALLVWLVASAAADDDVTGTTGTTVPVSPRPAGGPGSSERDHPPHSDEHNTSVTARGGNTSLAAEQDAGFRRADDTDLEHDTTPPPGDTGGAEDATEPPEGTEGGTTTNSGEQGGAPAGDQGETRSRLRDLFDRFKSVMGPAANTSAGDQTGPPDPPGPGDRLGEGAGAGSGEAVLRARAARGRHVPSAVELDMAPARGGAVHTLRTKNRLCHRHVMVPEGPKYDSRGKLYLSEFERVKGRAYPNTAAPALLLPKCCNCCRKSVLGCE